MRCPTCATENPPGWTVCASCGAFAPTQHPTPVSDGPLPASAAAGEVIAGRFELRAELGRGGSGLVYRAFDRVLGVDVALKLLQPGFTRDPVAVERLKREIIAARRITHRNVIRINEFGFDEKEAFVAMEYLTGGSLSAVLDEGAPPVGRGVQIGIGILEGLAAAHAVGVIHRDMKPDNVLFDGAGVPKLVDFGLARLAETSGLTVGFSGTPFYMSPEQGEGREITPKSDVYSTGVLFFELFTGALPFTADSLVRIAVLHAKQAPPSPRARRPDLPAPLESLILRMLAKDAAERPSAEEALQSLYEIAALLGDSVSLPRAPLARTPPPPTPASPIWPDPAPRAKRGRGRGTLVALGALTLIAAIAVPVANGVLGPAAPPTLTPTPVVDVRPSAEPTATATLAAAPALPSPSPAPSSTRLAAAASATPTLRTVVTPVPVPSAPARIVTGRLSVKSIPWVEVYVDGKQLSDGRKPVRSHALPVGRHVVKVQNPNLHYADETTVTIEEGREVTLHVDALKGSLRVEPAG